MTTVGLPLEVEENIIDYLWHDPPSLNSCSRVCAAWLPRSRLHLFSTIYLSGLKDLTELCRFLDGRPNIRSFIFTVVLCPRLLIATHGLFSTAPVVLLSRIPHVTYWILGSPKGRACADLYGDLPRAFSKATHPSRLTFSLGRSSVACFAQYRCLEKLHIGPVKFSSCADLGKLLIALTALKTLRCSGVGFASITPGSAGPFKARLSKRPPLSTLHSSGMDNRDLDFLLDVCLPNVEHLILEEHSYALADRQHFGLKRLSKLTLRIKYPEPRSRELASFFHRITLCLPYLTTRTFERLVVRLDCTGSSYRLAQDLSHSMTVVPLGHFDELVAEFGIHLTVEVGGTKRNRAAFWRDTVERVLPKSQSRKLLRVECVGFVDDPDSRPRAGHDCAVTSLAVSPNSKFVASGSDDNVIIWDAHCGILLQEWYPEDRSAHNLVFSPDSSRLAFTSLRGGIYDCAVTVASTSRATDIIGTHAERIHTCIWTPDGTRLVTTSPDGTLRVWDVSHRSMIYCYTIGHPGTEINLGVISRDGRGFLAGGSSLVDYHVMEISDHVCYSHPLQNRWKGQRILAVSPTARIAYGADEGNIITVVDMSVDHGGTPTDVVSLIDIGHLGGAEFASFSNDSRRLLVVSSTDWSMRVFDASNGNELTALLDGQDTGYRVFATCFSPDGRYIASASEDGSVRLWSGDDGSCIAVFTEHEDAVEHVMFTPDGESLVSAARDGKVVVRRLRHLLPRSVLANTRRE